jgi:hypothetical protein
MTVVTGFFVNCDAGIIGNVLIGPGQHVEYGGFAGILLPGQRDEKLLFSIACGG